MVGDLPRRVVAPNVHRLVSVAEFVGRAIERCARPEGIVVSTGLGEITELTDRSFRAVRDILEEHGTVRRDVGAAAIAVDAERRAGCNRCVSRTRRPPVDHERSPSGETAERFTTCAANVSPGGPRCGEPTTRLLIMTCGAEHGKLASTCDVHAAIAQELTEPGALSVCGLCEDLTGTAEPMTIVSVEPWGPTTGSAPA